MAKVVSISEGRTLGLEWMGNGWDENSLVPAQTGPFQVAPATTDGEARAN